MKRTILGLFSFAVLCSLAYYSSYLYSEQYGGIEEEIEEEIPDALIEGEAQGRFMGIGNRIIKIDDDPFAEKTETSIIKADRIEAESPWEQEVQEASLPQDSIRAELEYAYYLMEELGYVNIYEQDRATVFEYTDIVFDDLPKELQEEIRAGKGLANEQELYDFLENYSS